jgi:hypothetical protein
MRVWKIAIADRSAIIADEATARDTVWRGVLSGQPVDCVPIAVPAGLIDPTAAAVDDEEMRGYLLQRRRSADESV